MLSFLQTKALICTVIKDKPFPWQEIKTAIDFQTEEWRGGGIGIGRKSPVRTGSTHADHHSAAQAVTWLCWWTGRPSHQGCKHVKRTWTGVFSQALLFVIQTIFKLSWNHGKENLCISFCLQRYSILKLLNSSWN